MKIIFVEASIGAGKSTLLAGLENVGEAVVSEPVASWEHTLRLAYEQPGAFRLPMQLLALTSRLEMTLRAASAVSPCGRVFVERSMMSTAIFDRLAPGDTAYMDLRKTYESLVGGILADHHVTHMYIRCPVDTCMRRIAQRARPGEATISADYMSRMHEQHEVSFSRKAHILDGRLDADGVLAQALSLLDAA
jgi:deoxyadenosine/deoxycytidine kinase